MSVFKRYASVYDLLYKDKDYEKEALHIAEMLNKYGNGKIKKVLNLGCGTGRHDRILAGMGYDMTGVDLSEEMIEIANLTPGLKFLQGDIRTIDLKRKFDAVISMFHVMSYQNSNDDVTAVFKNAFRHLNSEGVFLFDCWYADAVLAERPEKRVKVVENDELLVTRNAVPVMHEDTRIVDVNYEIYVTEKIIGKTEIFHETHNMRYFSASEIKQFAERAGFEVIDHEINGWNLEVVVGKK